MGCGGRKERRKKNDSKRIWLVYKIIFQAGIGTLILRKDDYLGLDSWNRGKGIYCSSSAPKSGSKHPHSNSHLQV